MNYVNMMASTNYMVVNKDMAHKVGLIPTIVLSELCGEYDYYTKEGKTQDGWFFSTTENIENNTTLSYHQQTEGIKKLIEVGILEQENRGLPARRFFRINEKMIAKILENA